jgi:hypothetical protein
MVIGTTTVRTASQGVHFGQSWIQDNSLIAPYARDGQRVGVWAYPRGGVPKHTLQIVTDDAPLLGRHRFDQSTR